MPVTKDRIRYNSIYMKCPEWVNPEREVDQGMGDGSETEGTEQ